MSEKDLERELQKAIDSWTQENEELLDKIRSYNEDFQASNTKILILEQINNDLKDKEEETTKVYLE